jgi:NADH-quinone oxidoreductase subunit G
MVAQTAPSVRVALAEEVGLSPGTVTTGQMVAALRALGFDVVFDTDMSADLTIMEEGNELLGRLAEAWARELEGEEQQGAAPAASSSPAIPMFTSCCPAWVHLVETDYPSLIPHLSSCKSPQGMLAAVVKRVWWPRERERRRRERQAAAARGGNKDQDEEGEENEEEEERCVHVSVMPCVAKKEEARRPQLAGDVDHVLTTRELGRMLRLQRIPVASLPSDAPESRYDDPLGTGTGAGVLFGASGGVMEAALRTVAELATGEALGDHRLAFKPVDASFAPAPQRSPYNHATGSGHSPGGGELLEASLELPVAAILRLGLKDKERAERAIAALERQGRAGERKEVRVCVANGIAAARRLLDAHFAAVSADSSSPSPLARYHFLEVMSCVGGCVNGGGQPKAPPPRPGHPETAWPSVVAARTAAIRALDRAAPLRRSHLNPDVRKLYGMDDDRKEEEEGGGGGGKAGDKEDSAIAPPRLRGGVGGHDAHALLHTTYGPPGGGELSPPYPSERRARAAAGEGEKGGSGS